LSGTFPDVAFPVAFSTPDRVVGPVNVPVIAPGPVKFVAVVALVAEVADVALVAVAALPANVLDAFENVTTPLSVCVPVNVPVIVPGPAKLFAVPPGTTHVVQEFPLIAVQVFVDVDTRLKYVEPRAAPVTSESVYANTGG